MIYIKRATREKTAVTVIPNTRAIMLATLLMTIVFGMQSIADWTGQSSERDTWEIMEIILNSISFTICLSFTISFLKRSYSHKKAAKSITD